MFFKLLYENTYQPTSYKEAYALMFNFLAYVEEKAAAHNRSFCLGHEPVPMELDPIEDFKPFSKQRGDLFYRRTTKQYIILSITGAIEIHQFIYGQKIETFCERYINNTDDSLILTRPDCLGNDVWKRPLPYAIEHFSTYKK